MITRQHLSELMSFNPEQYLTTSLYLPIDAGPQSTHAIQLKEFVKQAKCDLDDRELSARVRKSVDSDLKRISDYVNLEFNKEGVRTLVVISCSGKKFWKTLTMRVPVRGRMVVNSKPVLRPLIFSLDQYSHFLAVLIERTKARVFEFYAGDIVELTEFSEEVPAKVREGGYAGYDERHIERHIDDHLRRHFKRVADVIFERSKTHPVDHLVLFGLEQNTADFRGLLHNTLQEKIVASRIEEVTATSSDIRDRLIRIEKEMKESQDRQLIERLFNQINSGGLGIIGLDPALKALKQGQVNVLLVQQGFQQTGYVCTSCKSLLLSNGSCEYCAEKTKQVHDIVEEAMQEALGQNCQVKYITLAGSRLATGGNIGAILRYKPK